MYSKQQSAQIRQDFWTRFGQYMKPVPSARGEKVNWPNYKSGIPQLYFRLRADRTEASLSIEITHSQEAERYERYAQLLAMKPMLETAMGEELLWQRNTTDENGKPISRISTALPNVNIFRESDWPAIISFLKNKITALDAFWEEGREFF